MKCFPFMLCVQSPLIRIPGHVRQIFDMVEAFSIASSYGFYPSGAPQFLTDVTGDVAS